MVGHPRTGTSFIARLLGSHPVFAYWEEPGLLAFARELSRQIDELARHAQVDAEISARGAVGRAARIGDLRQQFGAEVAVDETQAKELSRSITRVALASLHDDFIRRARRTRLVEKTPSPVGDIAFAAGLLPNARFVYCVRDVRAVAVSTLDWIEQWGRPSWLPGEADPVQQVADQWAASMHAARRDAGAYRERVLLIRFDELLLEPRTQTAGLLRFVGADFTDEVDEYLRSAGGGVGVDTSVVDRWRGRLTPDQIGAIVERVGPLLDEFGE